MGDEQLKSALLEIHTCEFIDRVYTEQQRIGEDGEGPITNYTIHARVAERSTVSRKNLNTLDSDLEVHNFRWDGLRVVDGRTWLLATEQVDPNNFDQ